MAATLQPLRILHISWLPSRRSLAEAAVASQGHAERPLRAAVVLMARVESLRELTGSRMEDGRSARREFWVSSRAKSDGTCAVSGEQRQARTNKNLAYLPSSHPPCEKIWVLNAPYHDRPPTHQLVGVRCDREPLRKLLRFGLRIGSPRCVESLAGCSLAAKGVTNPQRPQRCSPSCNASHGRCSSYRSWRPVRRACPGWPRRLK